MQIRIKDDAIEIEGYVNAVERKSKPLKSRLGEFVERISKGAFQRALERNDNVRCLINHDWTRDVGGTKDGNLELNEDNIGLRFKLTSRDENVIKKARNGDFIGCSFGFTDIDVETSQENGMTTRDVKDLNLYEVSILDRSRIPAYDGTLLTVRSEEEIQYRGEALITEVEMRDDTTKKEPDPPSVGATIESVDYSNYEKMISEMKEDK